MKVELFMRVSTDNQTNENQRIRLEETVYQWGWILVETYLDQEMISRETGLSIGAVHKTLVEKEGESPVQESPVQETNVLRTEVDA